MAESTSNIEMAHKIHEHGHGPHGGGRAEWIEIIEAVLLAIVAVATAWSGYQASVWDAHSAQAYAHSASVRVESQEKLTLAGQQQLYDVSNFEAWLGAKLDARPKLADFYERRFRPEYKPAFDAWVALDPFTNSETVPAGPALMPQYRSKATEESEVLAKESEKLFEEAVHDGETADDYVRITVFLATVLLLTALSQRFKMRGPRLAVIGVAGVLLVACSYWLATLPRV